MAGDPQNPLQSRPCTPSPRRTPQNRPRTPTALTWLQAAPATRTPSRCAAPSSDRRWPPASAKGPRHPVRRATASAYTQAVSVSVSESAHNARVAPQELLPRPPGTHSGAVLRSTDNRRRRGAELLGMGYPIRLAREGRAGGGRRV
jgi:hypothetical protein|eukprot:COSAG01_NODE_164_length_23340_cov_76.030033_19_plen_146_part_00